jgi:hypothetical protein
MRALPRLGRAAQRTAPLLTRRPPALRAGVAFDTPAGPFTRYAAKAPQFWEVMNGSLTFIKAGVTPGALAPPQVRGARLGCGAWGVLWGVTVDAAPARRKDSNGGECVTQRARAAGVARPGPQADPAHLFPLRSCALGRSPATGSFR